ncbi:50S ribosomal protein L23 [Clostridium thermosuccinogenes]|jgi:large subunit ribosomal protein L23|uniref:Large ribosomal subunit protein uL23 n=1 Tax=Clostridium thermosuccinogenes TaxID=84032 RepID=A0A2K2F9C9_9CLOT|nr:50S ribosomal protein L23 [Pseudoclostridium thermosuccinogenes]AUS98144.1 50S ribosomal protein L23 [Pseudoclostridium thermosuccinogenes]PNT91201.1 50S ribosomal protein L23 [Pseudoclostridium thermosuccinogenes]PNT95385.1 50S ribosomal protein L23 [Pseudoclostridium thermosuccinogenes]PNT96561.1 50S ribosomal protein L23 [Pseudoclostridium thermosuccinogenes]
MKSPEEIIKRPYITEKSNEEIANGKYTFVVDVNATKTDIKNAVEKLFQVKVVQVNTVNYEGKTKRMGVHVGPRPDWKKAIVKIDTDPKPETYKVKGGKETTSSKKYKTSIEEFGIS